MKYDRFNLEEEIQKVWGAVEDLDTILYRIMDASEGPPSEDDITTMLMGLKEIHNSRCMKLWDVFETMVQQKRGGGAVCGPGAGILGTAFDCDRTSPD